LTELSLWSNAANLRSCAFPLRKRQYVLMRTGVWVVASPSGILCAEGKRSNEEGDRSPAKEIVGRASGTEGEVKAIVLDTPVESSSKRCHDGTGQQKVLCEGSEMQVTETSDPTQGAHG